MPLSESRSSWVSSIGTLWRGYRSSSRRPASPREDAATSSRLGWRQTRRAARAPVNPEAPATRTRAAGLPSRGCPRVSATERTSDVGQGRLDPIPELRDVVLGQGPVRSPVLDPHRQALHFRVDLLAFVEVEDRRGDDQLAPGPNDGVADVFGRPLDRDDDCEIFEDGGMDGDLGVDLLAGRGGGDQGRQIDLEAGRRLEIPLAADQRVDLADPARRLAGGVDPGGAARVQEGLRLRLEGEGDAEGGAERLERPL